MAHPLYSDDIVVRLDHAKDVAVVERTHTDFETHTPYPSSTEQDKIHCGQGISASAFRRFLKDGVPPKDTVLVRYQYRPSLELLLVSKVKLVDRSLLVGDVVKRNVQDAQSGVVINTFTTCILQPMCDVTYQNNYTFKGLLPPSISEGTDTFCVYPNGRPSLITNVPASELEHVEPLAEDDLVVYKDWLGKVHVVSYNIKVRLIDNGVVEIADDAGELTDGSQVGFSIGDVVKTKKGVLRTGNWIFGSYNANTPPVGTVVDIRAISAEVHWLQRRIGSVDEVGPNELLETPELESQHFRVYQKSRRPTEKPEPLTSNEELEIRLASRVRFRDLTGACLKYNTTEHPNRVPKLDRQSNLGYDLNVFDIVSLQTTVAIQWQDLSVTTARSIDLVQDSNIDDEHAAWPSEIAHSLRLSPVAGMNNVETPERVGVVQSVDAEARMARIRWAADSYVHYAKMTDYEGLPSPILSYSISPTALAEEEVSLYDVEAPAGLNVRLGDIVLITDYVYNSPSTPPSDATWLGSVVNCLLDGRLIVRLGAAAEVRDVTLRREQCIVAVRSDGTDEANAWGEEEMAEEDDENGYDIGEFGSEAEGPPEEWLSDDEMDEQEATYTNEAGEPMDEDEVENDEWESADEEMGGNEDIAMFDAQEQDIAMCDAQEHQTPPTSQSTTPVDAGGPQSGSTASLLSPLSGKPPSYEILEGDVPLDHRFRSEPPTTTTQHVKRTHKEHKILRNESTLPEGVYVRSYETRMDLLRVLIVGPSETPYTNAPFVVDFYLPPSFPTEPPQLFFHSWPPQASIGGTIGRVNPNLYEDGKICLSILGTWEGGKNEEWAASRSTLLQVIVSLLGLVLVREPYYNEAGYEALKGSEESKRPSALYSERVFLRAKGFLITALGSPDTVPGLSGLGNLVRWLYLDAAGPRLLEATIKDVEEVLEKSGAGGEPNGLTVMSKGACIPLQRVLDRLRGLRKN